MRDGQKESDQQLWDELTRDNPATETSGSPLEATEETEKEMPGVPVVKMPLP